MRKVFFISILGTLVTFLACKPSDFEFPAYEATFFIPVLDVELSVQDMILADTNDIIRTDSTDLVILGFNLSEKLPLEEIIPYDDQQANFTIPGIPSEFPDISVDIPLTVDKLGILMGFYELFPPQNFNGEAQAQIEEFVQADFLEGTIGLTLTNNLPLILDSGVKIHLINLGDSIPVFEFSYDNNILPGETVVFDDADLGLKTITGAFIFRVQNLGAPGGSNVTIAPDDGLNFSVSLSDIRFKKAIFKSSEMVLGAIDLNIPLRFANGTLLEKAGLDNVKISVDIPGLRDDELLRITFLSITENGIPISFILGNQKLEEELTNVEMDLTEATPPFNILRTQIELLFLDSSEDIEVIFDTPIDGTIFMTDMDYGYQEGYVGFFDDVFKEKIDLDFFDRIRSGSIEFDDPRISVAISNGLGSQLVIEDDGKGLYIRGANNRLFPGDTVSIGDALDGFTLPSALSQGNPQSGKFILDKVNEPNFGSFLALFPTFLEVRMPMKGGTEAIDFDQFIYDTDEIGLDIELELPMFVAADKLIITDTSEYTFETGSETYEIQSAKFNSSLKNYFPLELTLQIYFLDSAQNVLDSLFDEFKVIDPAVIGEDGRVRDPLITEISTVVAKDEFISIKGTAFTVPVIKFNSKDGQFIKLYSDYKLFLKMNGEIITDVYL